MLRSFVCIVSSVVFSTSVFSQTFSPKVLATAGNYATGAGGISLSQTIGEPFNKSLPGGAFLLTQGQQQPPSGVIPLPVSWMNVSGSLNPNLKAVITWQVEETKVADYFIEKNTSSGYVTIGKINSIGDGEHTYSFTDPELLNGEANYRIKQISYDGKYSYSKIIVLKANNIYNIIVYPNPVITTFKIFTNNPALQNTIAVLYDPNGKKIKEIMLVNTPVIDLSNTITGMYLLRFADQTSVKIIKLDKY